MYERKSSTASHMVVVMLLVFATCKGLVCPRGNADNAPCTVMSTQTACLFCQIVGSPAAFKEIMPKGAGAVLLNWHIFNAVSCPVRTSDNGQTAAICCL